MNFGTVAILGPGLIGGSLALALAERGLTNKLVIWARNENSFLIIREKLPHATLTTDVIEAVRDADIVVLCVPIETMKGLVEKFANSLKSTALVTDVGSVKESVENQIAPVLAGKALWIGSHPMAGSEKSGFTAARADLFEGAKIIVTHTERSLPEAKKRVEEFWQKLGGSTLFAAPFEHDKVIAHISHLPHLAAAALVNAMHDTYFRAAGPGFRDTTRVALGSPDLWTSILSENRSSVEQSISSLISELRKVQESLQQNDKSFLCRFLQRAHDQRSKFLKPQP